MFREKQPEATERFSVQTFKSLEDVTVDLGHVNVFIGANGSGKVDEQALRVRGARPGVPNLYNSAFPAKPGTRILPHLRFEARSSQAEYGVFLRSTLESPEPVWRFKTVIHADADVAGKTYR